MIIPLLFYINQTVQLMYNVPEVPKQQRKSLTQKSLPIPIHVNIPKVRIDLPVAETKITNDTWGIAENEASHLSVSARPGEAGPIILYAHNTNNRFGPIRWLHKGDKIEIITADKRIHTYIISESIKSSPDQLSIFFKRKSETLYLFTCDGFADLKRYIIIADPIPAATHSASPVSQ
jgi:LPXTG-site transpeptidase (sortase) family protein